MHRNYGIGAPTKKVTGEDPPEMTEEQKQAAMENAMPAAEKTVLSDATAEVYGEMRNETVEQKRGRSKRATDAAMHNPSEKNRKNLHHTNAALDVSTGGTTSPAPHWRKDLGYTPPGVDHDKKKTN